ncbi:hypothetical protein CFOL_v3_15812 [Cephalotus follicularis]|uniref:Uncharacterized protein n=1 Tax=Cephalotus follicularis TaxID=3775 RepID=A0A1Q3BWC6_CEPFO|nr:hypothetical protein CFOL_v3_15812 [Cephalotus follicularis]
MGKSSRSSLKKKRSKKSSQARKGKTNNINSRRYKSKRAHRLQDSLSYSSDNDSRRLLSVSSFSSEDGLTSRWSRSRTRKDVKGSKKRARRRSSSYEIIEDPSRVRKRKGSKRPNDFEVRKKGHLMKMVKRDDSVSSAISGSRSCSTCRSGSISSSDDREHVRRRDRTGRKEKGRRKVEKVKSGLRKRKYSSRSCSPCSQQSEGNHNLSEERVTGEINSRRLRSVITVIGRGFEERESYDEEHKEEMVYDQDDYPSSRSNDSNDVGSMKELAQCSTVASGKKELIEDEKLEAVVYNIRSTKFLEVNKDNDGYFNGSISGCDMTVKNYVVKEKKGEVSGAVGSLYGGDLESILRQRALENLRRFRGGIPTDSKTPSIQKYISDSIGQPPSPANASLNQIKPLKVDRVRLAATQGVERIDTAIVQKDSTNSHQNDEKMSDGKDGAKVSGSTKQGVCPPHLLAGNPKKTIDGNVVNNTNKLRLPPSVWRRELSNIPSIPKKVPVSHEPLQVKLVNEGSVDKRNAETAQTVMPPSGNSNAVNNAFGTASGESSSCLKSNSGDISSHKIQDEPKEGPRFEQKKMSVMRGGEMVEVSYEVYIPKRTPALARRQLKR